MKLRNLMKYQNQNQFKNVQKPTPSQIPDNLGEPQSKKAQDKAHEAHSKATEVNNRVDGLDHDIKCLKYEVKKHLLHMPSLQIKNVPHQSQ